MRGFVTKIFMTLLLHLSVYPAQSVYIREQCGMWLDYSCVLTQNETGNSFEEGGDVRRCLRGSQAKIQDLSNSLGSYCGTLVLSNSENNANLTKEQEHIVTLSLDTIINTTATRNQKNPAEFTEVIPSFSNPESFRLALNTGNETNKIRPGTVTKLLLIPGHYHDSANFSTTISAEIGNYKLVLMLQLKDCWKSRGLFRSYLENYLPLVTSVVLAIDSYFPYEDFYLATDTSEYGYYVNGSVQFMTEQLEECHTKIVGKYKGNVELIPAVHCSHHSWQDSKAKLYGSATCMDMVNKWAVAKNRTVVFIMEDHVRPDEVTGVGPEGRASFLENVEVPPIKEGKFYDVADLQAMYTTGGETAEEKIYCENYYSSASFWGVVTVMLGTSFGALVVIGLFINQSAKLKLRGDGGRNTEMEGLKG